MGSDSCDRRGGRESSVTGRSRRRTARVLRGEADESLPHRENRGALALMSSRGTIDYDSRVSKPSYAIRSP